MESRISGSRLSFFEHEVSPNKKKEALIGLLKFVKKVEETKELLRTRSLILLSDGTTSYLRENT